MCALQICVLLLLLLLDSFPLHFWLRCKFFNGSFACLKEYRESACSAKCFKVLPYKAVGGRLSDDEKVNLAKIFIKCWKKTLCGIVNLRSWKYAGTHQNKVSSSLRYTFHILRFSDTLWAMKSVTVHIWLLLWLISTDFQCCMQFIHSAQI